MLQNLLSREAKKTSAQEYYLRLVTVCMLTLSVATIVGLAALMPAYMNVVGDLTLSENEQVAKQQVKQDGAELLKEIAEGEHMITFLENDLKKGKCAELLFEALRERPEGILITGFSYNRAENVMTLEGIAATRDLVVPFARALEANEHFVNVPVPIANLAKNTNLDFRLSLGIVSTETETQ
jgi:hypothetical protein